MHYVLLSFPTLLCSLKGIPLGLERTQDQLTFRWSPFSGKFLIWNISLPITFNRISYYLNSSILLCSVVRPVDNTPIFIFCWVILITIITTIFLWFTRSKTIVYCRILSCIIRITLWVDVWVKVICIRLAKIVLLDDTSKSLQIADFVTDQNTAICEA